jgi:hypothetical protein
MTAGRIPVAPPSVPVGPAHVHGGPSAVPGSVARSKGLAAGLIQQVEPSSSTPAAMKEQKT